MRTLLPLLTLSLLLWVGPLRANDQPAPAAPALDGLWQGPLRVPGGQLEVIFRLVRLTGGQYFATLDVPQQKVSRMSVRVELRGDTVTFVAEEAASRFVGQLAPDGRQLSGQWVQPGYAVAMTLRYAPPAAAPGGKVRLTPPYREEEVGFPNTAADLRLGGLLTVPPGPGPFPAVVLVADAGALDRDAAVGEYRPVGALADFLTRRGIAVLRCDARGVGSTGGQVSPSLLERVSDVEACLNYLRTRPEVDLSRLGVVGHGEGGNAALLAATRPLPPAFVVTLAAAGLPGRELARAQHTQVLRAAGLAPGQIEAVVKRQQTVLDVVLHTRDNQQAQAIVANLLRQDDPGLSPAAALAAATELTSERQRFAQMFDPVPALGAVRCPVLLLSGGTDLVVDADANLAALTRGLRANPGVTSKKLPAVNHLFQADEATWPVVAGERRPAFSPQAQEMIRAWILARGR
ncbi:alpha/beta hydrolase family protein [Hymenobacter latericus]|uniref:alpha/beta hydrolase family protein n=1 Tax=Hymenobacter sp. YIM 151858-1 TaxID=2987688 RepID=UPI0022267750|nr:alpha/beta hydrolase [Hymenobacter sp. YIM 151858-1]UYZ61246.1 alpha/beta hydrolase [Hymenobacter sp. YIM 151858-1]